MVIIEIATATVPFTESVTRGGIIVVIIGGKRTVHPWSAPLHPLRTVRRIAIATATGHGVRIGMSGAIR